MKKRIRKGETKAYLYCHRCKYQHYFKLDESRDYDSYGVFESDKRLCNRELEVSYYYKEEPDNG